MKKYFTSIIFIFLSCIVYGQSFNPKVDALVWQYSSLKNLANQQVISLSGKFNVYPSSKIEWIQKAGQELFSFQLQKTSGSWPDTQSDGEIFYYITSGDSQGTLKISKTGGKQTVELNLSNPGRPKTNYLFFIDTLSKLNN